MAFRKPISMALNISRGWIAGVAAGITALTAFSSIAHAEGDLGTKEKVRSVYLVKYRVNDQVRYNKASSGRIIKIPASKYLSSNPYTCTPSGFGQKSRCYSTRSKH